LAGAENGYSLVEAMVAALVLALAITGAMSMIGSGREQEYGQNLRRQAWSLAATALEDTAYHYSRYDLLAAGVSSRDTLLDSLMGRSITATLTVRVFAEDDNGFVNWGSFDPPTLTVHYRRIRSKVAWTVDGSRDSVEMVKRVTKVK
jgi:hypothetical protein